MRCIFLCLLSGILFSTKVVHGQSIPTGGLYRYDLNGNTVNSNVRLNEISTRAYRHFSDNYPAGPEKWMKTKNGVVASYVMNSKNYKIYYNKKGRFIYSIIYYDGKSTSDELTNLIARYYFGFTIKYVIEIFDGNKKAYGLTINNVAVTRYVEYISGELKTIHEYEEGK